MVKVKLWANALKHRGNASFRRLYFSGKLEVSMELRVNIRLGVIKCLNLFQGKGLNIEGLENH